MPTTQMSVSEAYSILLAFLITVCYLPHCTGMQD